jgi:hypothetical protein
VLRNAHAYDTYWIIRTSKHARAMDAFSHFLHFPSLEKSIVLYAHRAVYASVSGPLSTLEPTAVLEIGMNMNLLEAIPVS